jgi:hypothetical protein
LGGELLGHHLVERGFEAVLGTAEAGFADFQGVKDPEVDVLRIDLRYLET